ncbi:DUF5691 domain-containing protein [Lysobacter sp. CA199]|uniref:DUF5691 domain-containing protein n=1 Tax=Lysobacter sp. CA199 TaxID=3455608 RepID=UPI003F8D732B
MSTEWIKPALIGVDENRPAAFEPMVAGLLEESADPDAAMRYARGAAAMAVLRLAAVEIAAATAEPPASAPHDPRALADTHPLGEALSAIFQEGSERLQQEACLRLAALGVCLPARALPHALSAGQRLTRLRAALLPALGERGLWLARLNPDWRYASDGERGDDSADDAARLWQEGSFDQRLIVLRRARAADTAVARAMLQAQLGELPAKERVEFVAALDIGLHQDDQELLAGLLKDRSREVRRIAASLLARLPGSEHARRLTGWIAPLVVSERGLLGRRWNVDAPQAADPAWAAAAIDTARPQHDPLGERAWWLYQLARQVPLAWWCAHTGMDPPQLLVWAGKSDWKDALYRGWLERVGQGDADWAQAMLDAPGRSFHGHHAELLTLLPPAERVRHWPRDFEQLCKTGRSDEVVGACAPGESLPRDYSRAIVDGLRLAFERDRLRHDWTLRPAVQSLAEVLHPDILREWRPLPRVADETSAMSECVLAVERTVALRRLLHA